MEHIIALQADAIIIVGDNIYEVSSCDIRKVSPVLGQMLDAHAGSLKLEETGDVKAVLYFLQSAHGTFVTYQDLTPQILAELALLLEKYGVGPNNPPHDLVQFCFTKHTLKPSDLTPLDLSAIITVARVLGVDSMQQLLLSVFQNDNVHREIKPYGNNVQFISLLSNVLFKRDDLCVLVGNLLVRSAQGLSAVTCEPIGHAFKGFLGDVGLWILICRPCPSKMIQSLQELETPIGWENYSPRDEALRIIKDTCKVVEGWLHSEIVEKPCESQEENDDFGWRYDASTSPSEIASSDYDDDCAILGSNHPGLNQLERAHSF